MSKKLTVTAAEETEIQPTQPEAGLPATTEEQALATTQPAEGGLAGEWGQSDTVVPIVSLVQRTGDLADSFRSGSWVYDANLELTNSFDKDDKAPSDAKPRFEITVLTLNKYYRQNLPFTDPGFAKRWNSEVDALATPAVDGLGNPLQCGGNFRKGNKGAETFAEAAECILLFEVPEEYSEFEYDGKFYARGFYNARSTAWRVAKLFYSAAISGQGRSAPTKEHPHGQPRVYAHKWELGSEKVQKDKESYWRPKAINQGRHDDEFLKFVENEILGIF